MKARKVTAKEGERVVTSSGAAFAPYGSYVVEDNGSTRVESADTFESEYESTAKRKARKSTGSASSDTPPVVAGTKDDEGNAPDAARTARARVAATKAARSGGK